MTEIAALILLGVQRVVLLNGFPLPFHANPVFLNRTLSYMKHRMSRSHKGRKEFKVDNILSKIEDKISVEDQLSYMTLTFMGYYDDKVEKITSSLDNAQEPVKVELILQKMSHKKRKEQSSPFSNVPLGAIDVPINPSEDHPPPTAPALSVPIANYAKQNGTLTAYSLQLAVSCEFHCDHVLENNENDTVEPAQKRRKSGYGKGTYEDVKVYQSDLVVYDKHSRLLLTNGDYVLGLDEVVTHGKNSPKKHASWETINEIEMSKGVASFKGPTLKFRLRWTSQPSSRFVDRPKLLPDSSSDISNKENRPEHLNNGVSAMNNNVNSSPCSNMMQVRRNEEVRVVYQFVYNNNCRQQTDFFDLRCPWCSLDCGALYPLLKHLKISHSRMTFTYVPLQQFVRIDVGINENYDTSYSGSPHDLISQPPGFAFSRNGPVRRTSVSNILVCRPKKTTPNLNEFLEVDENEFDIQRPYITGHSRLYHHTTTCLPIYPKEMEVDSEGEHDPKWLQTKTMMMIDEFTDVNEGEKELMKMWNLHVMKHGFVGDCQIPLACTMFLDAKSRELLDKNLYRNFVLHMCSLFDFGLLSPVTLYTIVQKLHDMVTEDEEAKQILKQSWVAQRHHWQTVGSWHQCAHQQTGKLSCLGESSRKKFSNCHANQACKAQASGNASHSGKCQGPSGSIHHTSKSQSLAKTQANHAHKSHGPNNGQINSLTKTQNLNSSQQNHTNKSLTNAQLSNSGKAQNSSSGQANKNSSNSGGNSLANSSVKKQAPNNNHLSQTNKSQGLTHSNSDTLQQRRKSCSTATQQVMPLGNVQQNSLKAQNLLHSSQISSADTLSQQRRKPSSSQNHVVSGLPTLLSSNEAGPQRRKSMGNQHQSEQNKMMPAANQNFDGPLRRKSCSSTNSSSLLSSHGSESNLAQHRRKLSQIDGGHNIPILGKIIGS
uniref:Polycomb protein VEFS-Box domain-containing protein n=1 Tax=Timema monikensis TaxID=170555 RepID=A0A7R9E0G9_9NEOP|nr:unnamed protein product [Timema monikensis]